MSTTNWVIWLVVALVSAAICYKLAGDKGRSPVPFAVLGFILPLIGIIVAAVVGRKDATVA